MDTKAGLFAALAWAKAPLPQNYQYAELFAWALR
jgi:hypothetical protein